MIVREKVRIVGSGRTDAGVHAVAQVAHFRCHNPLDTDRCLRSLNGLLPKDLRIRSMSLEAAAFHAQYSATGKVYHYHLDLGIVPCPFRRRYSYHIRRTVDIDLLQAAAALVIGTHDFSAFTHAARQGPAAVNAIRTLHHLNVMEEVGGVRLEFEANGFLYKMVRNIVGTLVEVATRKREVADIPEILASRDRRYAGKTAPPHGLFLMKVHYPKG